MTRLDVTISGLDSSFQWKKVPVALTIRDERLRVVAQHSLRGEGSYKKLLTGETYFVSAELPSGETLDAEVTMPESGASITVRLEARQSPHEWLAESLFLGTATPAQWRGEAPRVQPVYNVEERGAGVAFDARGIDDASAAPATFDEIVREIHYSLWVYHRGSTWQEVSDVRHTFTQHDATAATFSLRLLEEQLYALQLGGARMRARTVLLPPASPTREAWHETKVLLRPARVPSFLNDGVAVKVTSPNTEVEALVHYLHSGDSYGAGTVADEIITAAKRLVREKTTDPNGTAIGAYYLLKVQKYRQLGEWLEHFAEWFPWLPDAPILYAARLLRYSRPDWDKVRDFLLRGTTAGLPVYSKGLQLLIDGLETLRERAALDSENDSEVEAALSTVRSYAACVDWTQLLTTFVSNSPGEPTLDAARKAPSTNAVAVL